MFIKLFRVHIIDTKDYNKSNNEISNGLNTLAFTILFFKDKQLKSQNNIISCFGYYIISYYSTSLL